MQDVLKVLPFTWFFGVEQFQEFLDERGSDMDLQGLYVSAIIDDQLQEELVDGLQMWPSGVGQGFFLHK